MVQLGKRTARSMVLELETHVHAHLRTNTPLHMPDFTEFKEIYARTAPTVPALRAMEISAVVCAPLMEEAEEAVEDETSPPCASAPLHARARVLGLAPLGVAASASEEATSRRMQPAATSRILQARSESALAIPLLPSSSMSIEELLHAAGDALTAPPHHTTRPIARMYATMVPQTAAAGTVDPLRIRPENPLSVEELPAVTHLLVPDAQIQTVRADAPSAAAANTTTAPISDASKLPSRGDSNDLLAVSGFAPHFLRLAPPLLEIEPTERVFVMPVEPPPLMWDVTMFEDTSRQALVRDIITRAMRSPIAAAQHEAVLAALDADPKALWTSGMAPCRLESVINNNPALAIEILNRIRLFGPATLFAEYLSELVRMALTLHSMEVVNQLTMLPGELPPEFLRLYISHCISSCESLSDKYMQNRLVRLVCVFLQSLIRNRMIHVGDLFVEVQAFCIEFSRIREAAGLFRVLKQMDMP